MGAGLPAGEDGGFGGLYRHQADAGLLLLQEAACAGEGAAGSHARHQDIHGPVGVPPDLRPGGLIVGGGVGGVVKLAGHPGRRQGGEQFVRLGDGALHALGAGGEHQLSS